MSSSPANIAGSSGSRRSEKRAALRGEAPSNRRPEQLKATGNQYENNAAFPGMHTVIVPKTNPVADAPSLIGEFKGDGYTIVSRDERHTKHSDSVLMGIPVEEFARRRLEEAEGEFGHNTMMRQPTVRDEDGNLQFAHALSARNPETEIKFRELDSVNLDEAGAALPKGPLSKRGPSQDD